MFLITFSIASNCCIELYNDIFTFSLSSCLEMGIWGGSYCLQSQMMWHWTFSPYSLVNQCKIFSGMYIPKWDFWVIFYLLQFLSVSQFLTSYAILGIIWLPYFLPFFWVWSGISVQIVFPWILDFIIPWYCFFFFFLITLSSTFKHSLLDISLLLRTSQEDFRAFQLRS